MMQVHSIQILPIYTEYISRYNYIERSHRPQATELFAWDDGMIRIHVLGNSRHPLSVYFSSMCYTLYDVMFLYNSPKYFLYTLIAIS